VRTTTEKLGGLLVLGLLAWPGGAHADLQLKLELEHRKLMRFEPIHAFVTIENDSGVDFAIEGDKEDANARLQFVIEIRPDEPVARHNPGPLVRAVRIKSGEKQRILVDLSRFYSLGTMRGYLVKAVVDWNGRSYASEIMRFSVENGIPQTAITRSLPGRADLARKYSLRYLAREKNERLFLCVDEEGTGVNYGTFDLGRLLRVTTPELAVDWAGNVRVVHQSSRDCHTWSQFKSAEDGVTFVDQSYHLADGSPYPAAVKQAEAREP
jgi:hypothetical protein